MFRFLNFQGVAHTDGYSVQIADRETLVYQDGSRTLRIAIDLGGDAIGVYLRDATHWQPPLAHLTVTRDERRLLKGRLLAALAALESGCIFLPASGGPGDEAEAADPTPSGV